MKETECLLSPPSRSFAFCSRMQVSDDVGDALDVVDSPECAASIENTLGLARRNGASLVEKLETCALLLEEEITDLEQRLWALRTFKAKAAWGDSPIRSPKREKADEKQQKRRNRWSAEPEVW